MTTSLKLIVSHLTVSILNAEKYIIIYTGTKLTTAKCKLKKKMLRNQKKWPKNHRIATIYAFWFVYSILYVSV